MYKSAIFSSDLMSQRIGYANLNDGAIWWEKKNGIHSDERPFKEPEIAHKMEEEYHEHLGLDWSYGGWMEERSCIRRGTYVEKDKLWLHIGIDVNVNPGTIVRAVRNGPVVYQGDDAPLVGGWGMHVIQMINYRDAPHALLYAHLGSVFKPDSPYYGEYLIGRIGSKFHNGFWRPHLHLQLFADVSHVTDWELFMKEMDGYAKMEDREMWARKCPDPTPLIFG